MRLTVLALLLALPALRADEGMWTFDNIPVQKIKAKYGVELDAAWLKKLQLARCGFQAARALSSAARAWW